MLVTLFLIVAVVGCTKNVYYTYSEENKSPVLEQPEEVQKVIILTPGEERELMTQWMQMHHKWKEEDVTSALEDLNLWDIHLLRIYRGSMIFYEESDGYLFIPEYEEYLRNFPEGMTQEDFFSLIEKNDGTIEQVFPGGDGLGAWLSFSRSEDEENGGYFADDVCGGRRCGRIYF